MTGIENMVGRGERVFWKGTPDKKCFILESIFNPLLPFALVWLLIDGFIISKVVFFDDNDTKYFVLIFMLLHLMPVWIYLAGVLGSVRKHRNTQYIVTERGIYVSCGLFSVTNTMKPFAELSNIEVHRGIIDQRLDVGDVILITNGFLSSGKSSNTINLKDLKDYQYVYDLIKRLQTDIYSDTMYPNDLRPGTNHGYRTEYTPNDRNY